MRFNIIHILPLGNNGPESYNEVIAAVSWGLKKLGWMVSYHKFFYSANINDLNNFKSAIASDAVNLVFGAQILHMPFLELLPENTVIYNLEQRSWFINGEVPDEYIYQAKRFVIWDYSEQNIVAWKHIWQDVRACYVKIGYAPILERIDNKINKDIDVLFYGQPTENRLKIFSELSSLGLKTVFAVGLFGEDRDNLIARAKVVLNIHVEGYNKIFEIVRVSYLLANSKAVVSEISPSSVIEDDIRSSLKFASLGEIARCCRSVVLDNDLRTELEINGNNIIKKRDMCEILANAWLIK